MTIKELKLTNEIIDNGFKELMPSANVKEINKTIEYKRIIVTRHFMERLEERFGLKGVQPLDVAKHIIRNRGTKHYSLSYKKIDSFMVKLRFGNVPANVFLAFNQEEDVYVAKTIFLDLNTELMKKIINDSEVEESNKIFKKGLNDKFFENISEVDFLNAIGNINIKTVAKSYIAKKDKYIDLMNDYQKEQLLKEANSFVAPKSTFKKSRFDDKPIDFDKGNGVEIDFNELYGDIDIII
ncbi:MAG: hypothetical protein KAG91_01950 [Mycoplasmataceae bacterium]|nr:hypothetical protein [Mycoplasmataceae bacterium]